MPLTRRKRFLLALLQQFDGQLERTKLQKLAFLACERLNAPPFDFVPFHYGCFSFQANRDLCCLVRDNLLRDAETWQLTDAHGTDYLAAVDTDTRAALEDVRARFGRLKRQELLHYVYTEYPYYATRSKVADAVLSADERREVSRHVPKETGTRLVSLGYEGLSLDTYLDKLLRGGVRVVCDVRKMPLSRKYGFSKKVLQASLEALSIEYFHFPELGIPGRLRNCLSSQADYDALFRHYENAILIEQSASIEKIVDLLESKERIALLCYEAEPERCHRTSVAREVRKCLKERGRKPQRNAS